MSYHIMFFIVQVFNKSIIGRGDKMIRPTIEVINVAGCMNSTSTTGL